jgi:hypothetical protein
MEKRVVATAYFLVLFALVNHVRASDGSVLDQFLGSPLLILVALLVIDIIALAYHKLRK